MGEVLLWLVGISITALVVTTCCCLIYVMIKSVRS